MRRPVLWLLAVNCVTLCVLAWSVANRPEPPRPAPAPIARREVVPAEPRQDVGPLLHEFGRPCHCESQWCKIGDTPYPASVGPNYYEDVRERVPAFYSVQVCFAAPVAQPPEGPPRPPEVIGILFQRDFRMDELPDGFLERSPDEIVSFDPATSVVTFHIGEK